MRSDGKKMNYCVLYTQVLRQEKLRQILKRDLPEGRGTVFYPCVETYRRDRGEIENRALFPGYVFIRSDMKAAELRKFVRQHAAEMQSYIIELRLSEEKAADDVDYSEEYRVSDLTPEETEFMDFLLGADEDGGAEAGHASGNRSDDGSANGDAPTEGLLRMSYGYKDGRKGYKVMKGPLRAYEKRIRDVNVRDRRAYLDFEIQGRTVSAGFEVRPKRYWFPDDEDAPEVLEDGSELDISELIRSMTNLKAGRAG